MPEKSPETIAALTYLWIFGLALLGGTVSYLKKLKSGKKWSWLSFATELITSAFAGVVTFFICESIAMPQMMTAALVGIAGNFSHRALHGFGDILDKLFERISK